MFTHFAWLEITDSAAPWTALCTLNDCHYLELVSLTLAKLCSLHALSRSALVMSEPLASVLLRSLLVLHKLTFGMFWPRWLLISYSHAPTLASAPLLSIAMHIKTASASLISSCRYWFSYGLLAVSCSSKLTTLKSMLLSSLTAGWISDSLSLEYELLW